MRQLSRRKCRSRFDENRGGAEAQRSTRPPDYVVDRGGGILIGNVRSWREREEAELAAWAAPGVSQVENRIKVGY
jgi:hypothetical protein